MPAGTAAYANGQDWQGQAFRDDRFRPIVLKKSASGAEIIGGWFAPEAADRLRRVAAVPASG
jgi:hypothetical protein